MATDCPTCPKSPFPDCAVRALREEFPIALPTLHLPCKFCKSLQHLNHERGEGGQELVVLHREYCFSLHHFLHMPGKAVLLPLQPSCFINSLQLCWNRNQLPEDNLRVNGPKIPGRSPLPAAEQLLGPQCRVAALTQVQQWLCVSSSSSSRAL